MTDESLRVVGRPPRTIGRCARMYHHPAVDAVPIALTLFGLLLSGISSKRK